MWQDDWLLTDYHDLDLGGISAVLIDGSDFINSGIFAFGSIVKELGVVRLVDDSSMGGNLDALFIDEPGDIGGWFTRDFDVKVETFAFANLDVPQIAPVDLWWN